MLDVILDALIDGIKVFPFLFLIYVIMELIESAKNKEKIEKALSGSGAPVFAGTLGIIPECGFSVMCAKLYDKGLIKIGTLIAAFIAVSDEGLIVLLPSAPFKDTVLLILLKILYAIIIGELINFAFSKKDHMHVCPNPGDCIECGEHENTKLKRFLLHPLSHAVKILLYIIIFNFIFGTAIYLIGENNICTFMDKNIYFQPVVASLIGLIPTCASSTMLSGAYINGILSFSGLIAGLSSNAGLGLLVLFRDSKEIKRNLFITCMLYISAVILGYLSILFGF